MLREGSWFLAIAYFMTALLFSYVSLDPTTAKWFSGLILLPAVATYALGLNETINMICKPFTQKESGWVDYDRIKME